MDLTREKLEEAISCSLSIRQVSLLLYDSVSGYKRKQIANAIKQFGINIDHFCQPRKNQGGIANIRKDQQEVLVRSCCKEHTSTLRRAMIDSGITYTCASCGCGATWNGKPLVLQIEHKDGNNKNNVVKNLEFQCPNCHTQTLTWGSRNKSTTKSNKRTQYDRISMKFRCSKCSKAIRPNKTGFCRKCMPVVGCFRTPWNTGMKLSKNRPDRDVLSIMVWELPATKIAEKYGVSDVLVNRWCREYGIDRPGRGYWRRRETRANL